MIDQKDIEAAYANLIEREKLLYAASEEEIQTLILFESAKQTASQKKPGDASWKKDPEYMDRADKLNQAQEEKRLAVHLHRLAKIEIQKLTDFMRYTELRRQIEEIDEGRDNPYHESDMSSRNYVPPAYNRRIPRRK